MMNSYVDKRDALIAQVVAFVDVHEFRKHRKVLTSTERAMLRLAEVGRDPGAVEIH